MAVQTRDIRADIRRADDTFEATFARGDTQGLAQLYTENGMLLPPGSDMIQGRPAIASFWQEVMNRDVKQVNLEIIEVEQYDATAVEIGRVVLRNEANEVIDRGKYVVIWKQEDGTWKLHRDIWNSSNLPAAE